MRDRGSGDGGIDEAAAVAAMLAWVEYQSKVSQTPEPALGTTYQVYDTLNFTTAGGPSAIYGLSINFASTGTNAGSEVDAAFRLDGGPWLMGALADYGITNGRFTDALTDFPIGGFAVGAHTFDLGFAQPTSPGITSMLQSELHVKRLQ